jgi:hypothetical protein
VLHRRQRSSPTETVDFLEEIDRRWPRLSFCDYAGAVVLGEAFVATVKGCA